VPGSGRGREPLAPQDLGHGGPDVGGSVVDWWCCAWATTGDAVNQAKAFINGIVVDNGGEALAVPFFLLGAPLRCTGSYCMGFSRV
jgi:hypothetical protein